MVSLRALKSHLRYGAIRVGLELSASSLTQRLLPQAHGRGVIFTLHHVRPAQKTKFNPNDILSVTPEFLSEAIEVSLECGLTPVHLHQLPELLSDPADRRNFVAFTLDDGYRNNAEFAAPIFQKFNIPYTIFITPGFVTRTRTMWWETAAILTRKAASFPFDFGDGEETVQCKTSAEKSEAFNRMALFVRSVDEDTAIQRIDDAARAMRIDPMAIVDGLVMSEADIQALARDPLVHFGAHTMTHVNLRRASAERVQYETQKSINCITEITGIRPLSFSYPYGWVSAVSRREAVAVEKAGIEVAVTTQPGVLNAACLLNLRELPRVSLNGYYQKRRYVKALISGIPFKLM